MAHTITTATGRVIDVETVTAGSMYPVLHIHTKALSGAEAYAIFSDPSETAVLDEAQDITVRIPLQDGTTETQNATEHRVYRNYTNLYSVGPSPFVDGALLIWLNLAQPREV